MKRLILALTSAAALTCTASAINALPAAAGGQSFYVSRSLSDTIGQAADPTIYNIGGNTYFKLRDLGRLLDFGVAYDHTTNAVHIDPNASYVPEPGENASVVNTATTSVNAVPTLQTMYLSGSKITPTVYNIMGSNYIGLRALGQLADFGVSYNYDNRRITAYAAYPYADESAWTAAMNDMANDLRAGGASYNLIAARHTPVIAGSGADWRRLISTLRAAAGTPVTVVSGGTLHRASLYWADQLTASITGTNAAATPVLDAALTELADSALFDNPDKTALQRDYTALSRAYLGAAAVPMTSVSVSNGYAKDARARFSLFEEYTLTGGATEDDLNAAKAYFADDMAALSALPTDSERFSYICRLLGREFRTGGSASWAVSCGKKGSVSNRSLAAAADWMFSEAGIPAFLARSYSTAWNVVCINGQWSVFDYTKGSALRSLDDYRLTDTHPGSTLFLTQVMRPDASYYNVYAATPDRYFTYTALTGKPQATAAQMQAYIRSVNPDIAQPVLDMIPLFLSEGEAEGIRGDIAFAQSCLETGNFMFTGSAVGLAQNNFCGLGVLDNGMTGASFDTPQLGIRAQIQHLKAYANAEPLKSECVDPRFSLVTRGAAPYVQYLGIQENPKGFGWASGADYGVKILNILENILTY